MLKIEQILRNDDGINVLGDSFDSINIKENHIIVKKDGLIGFYDAKTFKQILKCEWEKITFNGKYVVTSKHSMFAVFDEVGNQILNWNWDKVVLYGEGILVTKNGRQGFYNYNGNKILECIWKRIEPYSQLLIAYIGNGDKGKKFDYLGNEKEE